MNNKQTLLRNLPKVDKIIDLLKEKEFFKDKPYKEVYDAVNEGIDFFRKGILNETITEYSIEDIESQITKSLSKNLEFNFKRVINGTGTILHTNLGRALFSKDLIQHLQNSLCGYSNLEFDLKTGERGSRYSHVEDLIAKVTGAEAALVVNNNAAAVMLCLNEFSKDTEVIISRGELVEVGGSFRIPDIMELSNAKLVEIGTTNRTHLIDYEKAINENTSMLLKVHTSNYHITGFTKSVSNKEIADLAKEKNIISMEDLGSGVLVDFSKYGLKKEPTILESLSSGMDLITFSGDKLLGGPQCGIIIGKKELISKLKKNQFLRAFRVCKMTISALEFTFKQYVDEKVAVEKNPTLNRILEPISEVFKRAEILKNILSDINIKAEIIETKAIIGGGSMPDASIDSYGVVIKSLNGKDVETAFLKEETPIVGRVQNNQFFIDLKTIHEDEYSLILKSFKKFLECE
ncbi:MULTISPECIES: L-seryl-tRNA(Sec) selenium transferase [Cetobacterium]|jgi:L-seryl-tRNA(Ser) seleniumtransferase|uniref:L-seryl-tRNA(Sec) selenium transferase n=1 Tax=Candidatus Cetobacterium colombiensis TaxID=3073100 RepID=A0ABU4W7Q5_9FUSO|nr:L-seryl-tRNA(Sec) selenium transferase [Candidatus Cetobacterium colombiensis]MDX8335552.1 L-seryl-tRNA(Sec) selenium transferase [Candidatus Cetobacterium colombiensis]